MLILKGTIQIGTTKKLGTMRTNHVKYNNFNFFTLEYC